MPFSLYKHPVYTRYRAPLWSCATLLSIVSLIAILVLPYFLAYASYDFWKKENTYWEQPEVQFEHKLATIVHTSTGMALFSTIPEFNKMSGFSNVRMPRVQSVEDDPNLDGKVDFFNLTVTLSLQSTEEVYGVSALAFFYTKFNGRVKLEMTSLAFVQQHAQVAGSALNAYGDFKFVQMYPLSTRGSRTDYTSELLAGSEIYSIEDTQFSTILSNYFERNETMQIDNSINYWTPGTGGNEFTLDLRLRIPKSEIRYIPNAGEVLKFSWMQYLAVGIVAYVVFDELMYLAFAYGLVGARKRVDGQPLEKEHQF